MKLSFTTFPLLLFLFTGLLPSCIDTHGDITIKDWEVLNEQDKSLQNIISNQKWEKIRIPSSFKMAESTKKDFRFLWLKGEFLIREAPSGYRGLSTGRIRLSDETYINNQFIGSADSEKINWNPVPRNYIIPPGILKQGKNTIHIRLGIYGNQPGGITDNVLVQKGPGFSRSKFINDLIYRHIPFGIIILFIGFTLQSIISLLLNRKEKLYLYFSILLLILNSFIFLNLPFFRLVNFEIFHAIAVCCLVTGSIITVLAIQSLYRLYLSNINRIIIPLLLSFLVIILISTESQYFSKISTVLLLMNHIIILPFLIFIIYRLDLVKNLRSKRSDKFLLYTNLVALLLTGFIIVLETWLDLTGGDHSGLYVTFISPVAVLFFSLFTAREITRRQLELEFLYEDLKQSKDLSKDRLVTEASKEKLERVIDFIDKNFTHDISREGLAAAVDMSPSYMGTQFKTYKGITISGYINKRRIDEAISLLQQGSMKIIDIAFSVGFENIVNFNRVFKKITGKTPSEYRKNLPS